MSTSTAHETYLRSLLEIVRSSRYPSHAILDRVEAAIADRQDAEAYLSLLMEQTRVRHPSLAMLDRAARVVGLLALADRSAAPAQPAADPADPAG